MPRRVARERDEAEIACWLAEDWPRIKRKARRRGASLVLMDESGLLMAPLRRRSWALCGHPPQMKQKARHREKVSVAGALCLTPRRDRLTLAYQTRVNGYFDNVTVAEFRNRSGLGTAESWGRPETLADHFRNHGADFGAATADEYARLASEFLMKSQARRLPTKIGSDGISRLWDPATNRFGAYNPDGTTRTFYKPQPRSPSNPRSHRYPTHEDYCSAQPGNPPWTTPATR